jgi:predicted nucleotidyltransferase
MKANEKIKELFFSESTKHWHFDQLIKSSGMSRARTSAWLKKLQNENLIKRIKPKGKMPYYIAQWDTDHFKTEKELYGLKKLTKSGLLTHLRTLQAKTVILFGSFSRWDWHKDSDIDLFIYGGVKGLNLWKYEKKLKHEIQLFHYEDSKSIKRLEPAVLKNIMQGLHVKGKGEPFMVKIHDSENSRRCVQ